MKRILAISGGVDSMVMLDILARKIPRSELVIVHFDHGIRSNSQEDAEFVKTQSEHYGIEFVMGCAKLGESSSEDKARRARYDFLRSVAATVGGEIYTAHHLDDLVGSVAINLIRGTGWRGLAVLNAPDIKRPFLDHYALLDFEEPPTKGILLEYASRHNLHFREDQTNSWDEYLRNRLYHQMNNFESKKEIFELWQRQIILCNEIDAITGSLLPQKTWQRAWFDDMEDAAAIELLRAGLLQKNISATRPQLRDFLSAIRKYTPGKYFNLPGDQLVKIGSRDFVL